MNKDDTFDKVFDTILYDALKSVESEPNSNLPEEMDVEFSEKHKAEMKKIFEREKKKVRIKQLHKSASRAVVCLMVLVLVSGVMVMSVNALRIRFLNFAFNISQSNTEITAVEDSDGGRYDTDRLSFEYIPVGFALAEQKISDTIIYLKFSNGTDYVIILCCPSEGMTSIDTENAECSQMTINGMKALYSENENGKILVIYDDNEIYMVKGTISKEEIVEIAQNLRKK